MHIPTLARAALVELLLMPCVLFADPSSGSPNVLQLRYVTVVVKNYEEALAWYTGVLGLKKIEDRNFGPGHRWLVVAPEGQQALGIVLDLATPGSMESPSPAKGDRIGKETNWVFQVKDCRAFYDLLTQRGVHFIRSPTDQPWGTTQAVFEDLYGNVYVAESKRSEAPVNNGQPSSPDHP